MMEQTICLSDLDAMLAECQQMQDYLEVCASDDANELVERLTYINVYMARSAKLLADAKLMQDKATVRVFAEHGKAIVKMPATIAAKFIGAMCEQENYLVNWLDRINRALVHQGDNIRTQVSFNKEQLKLTRNGY